MKIIKAYPPIFPTLCRAFPQIKGRQGILYAWGDRIYNPSGITLSPWLIAHEGTHGARQLDTATIEDWWEHYIRSSEFRLAEELVAHRSEWHTYREEMKPHTEQYLDSISERLSSPLYGSLVSYDMARKMIEGWNP